MLKAIWNWLRGVETRVEHIVSPLSRIVDALRTHANNKIIERAQHIENVTKSSTLANLAHNEADQANSIADKLADLIG